MLFCFVIFMEFILLKQLEDDGQGARTADSWPHERLFLGCGFLKKKNLIHVKLISTSVFSARHCTVRWKYDKKYSLNQDLVVFTIWPKRSNEVLFRA